MTRKAKRDNCRGATWAGPNKREEKGMGDVGNSFPPLDVQGNDWDDAWYFHSDNNAWLASSSWSAARPEDENLRYVDVLSDIIPFWLQEVAAAEKGEKLRYGQFLDDLQAGKREALSEWGLPVPAWADRPTVDGSIKNESNLDHSNISMGSYRVLRGVDATVNSVRAETLSETSLDRDDFNFVEKVAILNGLSPIQKEEMRRFYKISTDEKIKRIEILIDILRKH